MHKNICNAKSSPEYIIIANLFYYRIPDGEMIVGIVFKFHCFDFFSSRLFNTVFLKGSHGGHKNAAGFHKLATVMSDD